jgi:hypothetical protein
MVCQWGLIAAQAKYFIPQSVDFDPVALLLEAAERLPRKKKPSGRMPLGF